MHRPAEAGTGNAGRNVISFRNPLVIATATRSFRIQLPRRRHACACQRFRTRAQCANARLARGLARERQRGLVVSRQGHRAERPDVASVRMQLIAGLRRA